MMNSTPTLHCHQFVMRLKNSGAKRIRIRRKDLDVLRSQRIGLPEGKNACAKSSGVRPLLCHPLVIALETVDSFLSQRCQG